MSSVRRPSGYYATSPRSSSRPRTVRTYREPETYRRPIPDGPPPPRETVTTYSRPPSRPPPPSRIGGSTKGPPSVVSPRVERTYVRPSPRRVQGSTKMPPSAQMGPVRRNKAWPPPNMKFPVWTGEEYEMRPPPGPERRELRDASPRRYQNRSLKIVKCVDLTNDELQQPPWAQCCPPPQYP